MKINATSSNPKPLSGLKIGTVFGFNVGFGYEIFLLLDVVETTSSTLSIQVVSLSTNVFQTFSDVIMDPHNYIVFPNAVLELGEDVPLLKRIGLN